MIRIFKNILLLITGFFAGRKTTSEQAVAPARPGWRLFFKRLGMVLPVLALGGFLLAASGIVPIKASSGHWAITRWFLEFSKSRSVTTHTIGTTVPPLEDRALVVKGAGHYEIGCRSCHGGVEMQPVIASRMTPQPPHLPPRISRWDPEELFYIVKHGIKFTGMPAWPSQERDDEVWAVVAFLLRLPDLDATAYRQMVQGDVRGNVQAPAQGGVPEDAQGGVQETDTAGVIIGALAGRELHGPVPETVQQKCAHCHGPRGEGREVSAFPRLAGQQANYMYASLRVYAAGERHSGIMQPIAAGMSDEEMREAALYFARSDPSVRLVEDVWADTVGAGLAVEHGGSRLESGGGPPSTLETGREIAFRGVPARKVPSCVDCHGPVNRRRNPLYPILAGQYADYIALQLDLFKERRRGGSAFAHIMHHSVSRLTEAEMRAVALFYESLGRADLP